MAKPQPLKRFATEWEYLTSGADKQAKSSSNKGRNQLPPPLQGSADQDQNQVSRASVAITRRSRNHERGVAADWRDVLKLETSAVYLRKKVATNFKHFLQVLRGGNTSQRTCIVIMARNFKQRVQNCRCTYTARTSRDTVVLVDTWCQDCIFHSTFIMWVLLFLWALLPDIFTDGSEFGARAN